VGLHIKEELVPISRKMQGLLALSIVAVGTGAVSAERAAGIEYEFVSRPAEVPADYDAPADTSLRFLSIKAIDGSLVDAALWQPAGRAASAAPLLVSVHGSGGSFHAYPNGFFTKGMAGKGYAVLGINTRQSGKRVNTDNFLEVRRDIEAAVYTARALGYRKLVLHGHSLGNIQVQFYAANNWEKDIKAVVLTGAFGNLPWKSRNLLVRNEQNWGELLDAAMKSLREGKDAEIMPVQMYWITGQKVPMTGRHFLTYRSENSSPADGTYWIRRVPYPVLIVRDEGDAIVEAFEPNMLLAAATTAGSLVPSVKYVLLPNKARGPAEHNFVSNRQALVDTVSGWLTELGAN
jgi:pimeloyl-ACP methyl ester carboxylesterase